MSETKRRSSAMAVASSWAESGASGSAVAFGAIFSAWSKRNFSLDSYRFIM